MKTIMQVEYEITPDDHLERTKMRYKGSFRRVAFLCLGALFLILGLETYSYPVLRTWSMVIIALAGWIVLLQIFLPYVVHWLVYYRNRGLFARRKVSFDENGIVVDGPSGHLDSPWSAFAGFRESKSVFLIHLSPDAASIVPKRAFEDQLQIDEFKSLLARKLNPL